MGFDFTPFLLLAQDAAKAAVEADPDAANRPPGWVSWLPLVGIGVFAYLILVRPEQRKHSDHRKMIADLKGGNRVVTFSGIYGVVTNVNRQEDSVTLRIDENTNTKMQVRLGAIERVISGSRPAENSS